MYNHTSMSDYLDPANEELLKDFFAEAESQVELLEQNVLALENDPTDGDAIDEIFRAAHTLKGNSAAVEMAELTEFTHLMEDVLDEIRTDRLKVTEDVINVLLASIDIIKSMLAERSAGGIYDDDITETSAQLKNLMSNGKIDISDARPSRVEPAAKAPPPASQAGSGGLSEYEILEMQSELKSGNVLCKVSVSFNEDNPMNTVGGVQVYAALKQVGLIAKTDPDFDMLYEDRYYPRVDYYVTTERAEQAIVDTCTIRDVTSDVSVTPVETPQEEGAAEPESREEKSQEARTESGRGPAIAQAEIDALQEDSAAEKKQSEKSKVEARAQAQRSREKKTGGVGSVLRVDSRRIDDLLNLVTESVINKATFNQVSSQFNDALLELQSADLRYKEGARELIERLMAYLDGQSNGESPSALKKEFSDRLTNLTSGYDKLGASLKSTISLFKNTSQILSRISGELQEGVMKIRMVPVSHIFSRFPRLVRDLSKSLNKDVTLHIEGEDTELDKSVIEDLLDPLIHCVRNSLDHGIESPSERARAGKSPEGNIHLRAANEGNMIIIEIFDDGKGIDVEKVRQKAIDRGVIHPSKNLSDVEAFNLIFDPGFSTAAKVTNLSGRGVGLDVVRKHIEKLSGSVSVWSEKGKGTRMTINLPLTLAIIQGLLVRVGKDTYALPIASVVESHRIKLSDIKRIDNYEVFNIREDVYSLIRLDRLFKIQTEEDRKSYYVVLVGSGDKKVGLRVDSLIGEEDVVIKPLKDQFTNAPGIAGATILGDGTVALIIDVNQLLEFGLKSELRVRQNLRNH